MAVPPVVSQLLRATSPTLLAALALPPPINALASAVASAALARFASGAGGAPLTPDEVTKVIESHASDPGMVPALRQAEVDLKRYEDENRFRFAELEARDRQSARDFQVASGIERPDFHGGHLDRRDRARRHAGDDRGPALRRPLGRAARPGQGQRRRRRLRADRHCRRLRQRPRRDRRRLLLGQQPGLQGEGRGAELAGRQAQRRDRQGRAARNPAGNPVRTGRGAGSQRPKPAPTTAAKLGDIVEELRRHAVQHRHFEGSVTWALTPEGISVEGAKPMGTTGAPNTVKAIWEEYGVHCAAAARDFTVPVELIVATIATESSGKPDAVRKEAKDTSYGLMQTLLMTAREALGDERLSGQDLLRPETSIRAGTAFIVRQRNLHKFDPVLVAAAYNAGSPRRADHPGNRWRLYCYPPRERRPPQPLRRLVQRCDGAVAVDGLERRRHPDVRGRLRRGRIRRAGQAGRDRDADHLGRRRPDVRGRDGDARRGDRLASDRAHRRGEAAGGRGPAEAHRARLPRPAARRRLPQRLALGHRRVLQAQRPAERRLRPGHRPDAAGAARTARAAAPQGRLDRPRRRLHEPEQLLVQPLPRLPQHRLPRGRRRERSAERGRVRPVQRPARGLLVRRRRPDLAPGVAGHHRAGRVLHQTPR